MVRIILPLAVIAVLLFTPIFSGEPTTVGGIDKPNVVTGNDYVGNTVSCWIGGTYSIAEDCAPEGGKLGLAIFGAIFVSAVAAVLGVLGLLPLIGRLTSMVTTVAGVAVIAAMGFYIMTAMGGDDAGGINSIAWGSYLAGGGGLLTLISGLSGMRGR
ncbi:MAG: hypothetical protein AAF720_05170 [Pseudomonadota bacterium]